MQEDFFAYDFGVTASEPWKRPITNPTELIGRDELQALLGLCQTAGAERLDDASDYELFRALCSARPYLLGHSFPLRAEYLLKTCFGISATLSADACDTIWRTCVEQLRESKVTLWDCICKSLRDEPIRCLLAPLALSEELPLQAEPVLDGTFLCRTVTSSWKAWEAEMQAVLDGFGRRGCSSVFYRLPKDYTDVAPNPYSVEQVLTPKTKNEHLLLAQGFRFLSEACAKRGWTLLLRVECNPEDALALLKRTERTVGIPTLVWTTSRTDVRDTLLDFTAQSHSSTVRCGLFLADHPSDLELDLALSTLAARYPLGRLAVLSGVDLRHAAYERSRVQSWISKKQGDR